MQTITLAIKLLFRDWRAGELRVLIAALIIAVAALTAIVFYTDRLGQAVANQAAELLGGDLVVNSPTPLPEKYFSYAEKLQLKTARLLIYPTMLSSVDNMQLTTLKAVNENYPLYGQLKTRAGLTSAETITSKVPGSGEVWIDSSLASALAVKVGNEINIGSAKFKVTRLLTYEPDTNRWFFISPRALINLRDVAATKTVLPGSRVEYRLLITGNKTALQNFIMWLKPQLQAGQKILTLEDSQTDLENTLTRAKTYLHLAALICALLAGIAIAACTYRYQQRHQTTIALLRCLGLVQKQIVIIVAVQIALLGLIGSLTGTVAGYFLQTLFADLFSAWWQTPLPSANFLPGIQGFILGFLLLIGFALPRLVNLKNVAALQILRNSEYTIHSGSLLSYVIAAIIVFLLLLWITEDFSLTTILFYGLTITATILYGASIVLIKLLTAWRAQFSLTWRYGLANLARRAHTSTMQLIAFGLVIMLLLILTFVRNDLINSWRMQLPVDVPNYFAINIDPGDVIKFKQFLKQNQINPAGVYPMVRGRLTLLNKQPIQQAVSAEARRNNALNRELNLTWASSLPADNRITAGRWWNSNQELPAAVSIEAKLASDLNIHLGDLLSFQIGDQTVSAIVTSLRSVEWNSFRPNFYMIFPPGVLDNLPATYITSFHINEQNKIILNELKQNFPSVTLIDISNLLYQINSMISKISRAVEYLLGFALLAGVAVLFAALQTSLEERRLETALLRTLGASHKNILLAVSVEFACLGFLAGLLAASGALLIAFVLAKFVFNLNYQINFWIIPLILFGSSLFVCVAGLAGTYPLLRQTPLTVLRKLIQT